MQRKDSPLPTTRPGSLAHRAESTGTVMPPRTAMPATTPNTAFRPLLPTAPSNRTIVPPLDLLPHIETSSTTFSPPVRKIHNEADMQQFRKSIAWKRLLDGVRGWNEAVKNVRLTQDIPTSEHVQKVIQLLDVLDTWIDEVPPEDSPQRFGNKAFRTWSARLAQGSHELHQHLLSPTYAQPDLIAELSPYLINGFGHPVRIDYGSGHELSFAAWLFGLEMIGFLQPPSHTSDRVDNGDRTAGVLRIFARYLEITRRLQRTYTLEPAGSHGVWGLDDYCFLPYLWGAAQLFDQDDRSLDALDASHVPDKQDTGRIKPDLVMHKDTVMRLKDDYLYFGAIASIYETKRGPFPEHSPLLYDISAIPTWHKINGGMVKMWLAEVLGKLPVVQHFVFGGALFPFETAQ